jgi:hypothetical protein
MDSELSMGGYFAQKKTILKEWSFFVIPCFTRIYLVGGTRIELVTPAV